MKLEIGKRNFQLTAVTILYVLICLFLYSRYGVKYVNDSFRYIDYARGLKSGFYIDPHNIWYFGYVIFVYCIRQISEGFLALIIAQYLLGYLAVLALFQSAESLFSTKVATTVAIAYILFVDGIYWHSYILAESFYLSMVCISLYFLVQLYQSKLTRLGITGLIISLAFTFLSKPTAVAMFGALGLCIGYLVLQRIQKIWMKWIIASTGVILFLLVLNKMLVTFRLIENYQTGEIVYAMSTFPNHPDYNSLVLEVPSDIFIPDNELPPLIRLIQFVWYNPVYWFQLSSQKIGYSLMHIRPYWSVTHNLYVLAFLIPAYTLAISALFIRNVPKILKIYTVTYFFLHLLIFGFTTTDWDGRFFISLVPVLFLWAGARLHLNSKKSI